MRWMSRRLRRTLTLSNVPERLNSYSLVVDDVLVSHYPDSEQTINLRLRLPQHDALAAELLDMLEMVEDVLGVADLLLPDQVDLAGAVGAAALADEFLERVEAGLEGLGGEGGDVEDLKGDVLPVGGVDGFDDGDGGLEGAAPAEELAVEVDVFGEFWGGGERGVKRS